MGASQRRKGARGELEFVAQVRQYGHPAKKISAMYQPGPDVVAFGRRTVEVKRRNAPPAVWDSWLKDAQMAAWRRDRGDWLMMMPLTELCDLLDDAERVGEERVQDEMESR